MQVSFEFGQTVISGFNYRIYTSINYAFDRWIIYLCFMDRYLLSWYKFVNIYYDYKLEFWFYRSITTVEDNKIILQYKVRLVTDLQVYKILKCFSNISILTDHKSYSLFIFSRTRDPNSIISYPVIFFPSFRFSKYQKLKLFLSPEESWYSIWKFLWVFIHCLNELWK